MAEDAISILLVEDDRAFLGLLTGMLSEEGYDVLGAASGEDALEVAQGRTFDLVITDVKLGGIDGLDTLQELKRGQSEFQSLVITGYATEADSVRAISLGVGDYMRKPFTLPDFMRAVNRLAEEIHKERGLSNYLSEVKEALLWGLEIQSRTGIKEGGTDLIEAAKLAESAARKKGLTAATARHIRLAVLACGLKNEGEDADIPFLFNLLPEESGWLTERLQTEQPAESLEEKLVANALQKQLAPGEIEIDEEPEDEEEEAETSAPETSLSLLALARALEVSGDLEGATLVLDRVEQSGGTTNVQANLLQARVHYSQGRFSEAESLLHEAERASKDLLGQSKIKLEGGLLFGEMGKKELAQDWIAAAAQGFEELSSSAEAARSKLALWSVQDDPGSFQPETLSSLLSPGNLEVFLSSARWLYPYLLTLPEGIEVERALQRLTRDLPIMVSGVLEGQLSEPQKLAGLKMIERVGIDGYDDLLQQLLFDPAPAISKASREIMRESRAMSLAPVLRLYSLGTMAAWVGERKIPDKDWSGRKPAYLLTYLAQHAGQMMSQDFLAELFWPGSKRGVKNLNQTVFLIRNTLRSPEWPEDIDYIFRTGNQIGLNSEQTVWFDAGILRQSLQEAQRLLSDGQKGKAADQLQQALEVDRGPYLEANYEDWALVHRDTLQRDLSQGLNSLAEIRLDQGRPQDAILVSRHLLERDPLDERASTYLFKGYLDSDQPVEVIRAFEKLEKLIKAELDVEPSLELVKLYQMAKMKV